MAIIPPVGPYVTSILQGKPQVNIINNPEHHLYALFRDPSYEDPEFRKTQIQRYNAWWDRSLKRVENPLLNGENYVITILCAQELKAAPESRREAFEANRPLIEKMALKISSLFYQIGCKASALLPSRRWQRTVVIILSAATLTLTVLFFMKALSMHQDLFS